jgi:hypothetical protein
MSEAITVRTKADFSGLHLEQTVNGNAVTPFFTFPLTDTSQPYEWSSNYHAIVAQSKAAFCALLNIQERDVMVTEKRMPDGEIWWRLGTAHPCALPKLKRIAKKNAKLTDGPPAIDI